jgi:DNA-binding SARP family transcriptional activator
MQRCREGTPGSLIRLHRQAAGMTQKELAEAARMSIGVVRDLEQGLTGRPRGVTVRRLAAALGLDARATEGLLAAVPRWSRTGLAAHGLDAGDSRGLRISVLGPLTASVDGAFILLGPQTQRAVLGLLALHANTAVHRDALIDALWGDDPPGTAVAMVQSYISRLRRLLTVPQSGEGQGKSLITSGTSYQLCVTADEVDQIEFARQAAHAQEAHAAGEVDVSCGLYARALDLWRGEPLADVKVLSTHPAVLDLGHQRAGIVLKYADAAFQGGRHDQVLRPLRAMYHREPLNERVAARLMIALAGSGCQAEALCVYDQVRQRLDDQLGVYPCAELSQTQAMVLRQQVDSAETSALVTGGWGGGRGTVPDITESDPWLRDRYLPPGSVVRAAGGSARGSLSVLPGGGGRDGRGGRNGRNGRDGHDLAMDWEATAR